MYDCLSVETRPYLPTRPGIDTSDHSWRNRLYLTSPRDETPQLLWRAGSAAAALGFASEKLGNVGLVILDLDLEAALLLTHRFPTLLVRYEPARTYRDLK